VVSERREVQGRLATASAGSAAGFPLRRLWKARSSRAAPEGVRHARQHPASDHRRRGHRWSGRGDSRLQEGGGAARRPRPVHSRGQGGDGRHSAPGRPVAGRGVDGAPSQLSGVRRAPRSRTRSTGPTSTCCAGWSSTGPTRSGAPTSRTSRCGGASCTWWR